MQVDSYGLVRGANVEVRAITGRDRATQAEIVVNDKFLHRFPSTSRVSRHLADMTPAALSERMTGGSFFFVNDQLVDWRDGHYHGFTHDDHAIDKFMETIGCAAQSEMPLHRRARRRSGGDDVSEGGILLRKVWSKGEIQVPGFQQGGDFNSQLSFAWNPFVKTVNSMFDLIRLICTNGMVGMTTFLNTKVPLFNRWDEHLDIASRQIQNRVNDIVVERIQRMATERASVADCLLLANHANERLTDKETTDQETRDMLLRLLGAISPQVNLSGIYNPNIFNETAMAAQLPSHLTMFDAFNAATQMRSHSPEGRNSTHTGLDRFANRVLFDMDSDKTLGSTRFSGVRQAVFSDPEAAFISAAN